MHSIKMKNITKIDNKDFSENEKNEILEVLQTDKPYEEIRNIFIMDLWKNKGLTYEDLSIEFNLSQKKIKKLLNIIN